MKKSIYFMAILLTTFGIFASSGVLAGTTAQNEQNITVCETKNIETTKLSYDNANGENVPCNGSNLKVCSKSAYLCDSQTGTVLYANNENERLKIASMTKIMLLNLVFENIENKKLCFDDKITISERAASFGGSQVFLQANKEYLASDLIKSVIIASANDASVVLAEHLYGSEDGCVEEMNNKAKSLGLENTLFSNCTGLPMPSQYSSAKDVAIMLSELAKHEDYYKFSSIWLDKLVHPDGQETVLTNTNKLVKFYKGCDGGKTGFTSEALFCLGATAKRGALRLISVVIGEENSKQRFADVSSMFDYGFANAVSKVIVDNSVTLEQIMKVKFGKEESVKLIAKNNYSAFEMKGESFEYRLETNLCDRLEAPFEKGTKAGEIVIYRNNIELARVDVVTSSNVERSGYLDNAKKVIDNWGIAS